MVGWPPGGDDSLGCGEGAGLMTVVWRLRDGAVVAMVVACKAVQYASGFQHVWCVSIILVSLMYTARRNWKAMLYNVMLCSPWSASPPGPRVTSLVYRSIQAEGPCSAPRAHQTTPTCLNRDDHNDTVERQFCAGGSGQETGGRLVEIAVVIVLQSLQRG
jgi:hypothetical protein